MPSRPLRRPLVVAAMVTAGAVTLSAHDFWIAASVPRPRPGTTVVITANVGDNSYPDSQSVTAPERIESLRLVGPSSSLLTPKFRTLGNALATDVVLPPAPATYMVVMTVKGRFLSMGAAEFTDYLNEEGLTAVIAERQRRGEASLPSRERYSRQAKTLIHAGDGPADHVTRPVGLVAEMVPDTDVTRAHVGDTIAARLLFDGQPVANAQVSEYAAGPGHIVTRRQIARTDKSGRASFVLRGQGPFLLTTTHMVRRTGETGPDAADWESYWVSLTFDIQR